MCWMQQEKIMKYHGDWNYPDKQKSFSTPELCIHEAHKETDTYVPSCEDYQLMPGEEWFKGCDSHKGQPLYSLKWKSNKP